MGVSPASGKGGKESSHWKGGVSWETPPAPPPFTRTHFREGEGLKSGPWKGGVVCVYFSLWLLALGLTSLAKGSAS